MRCRDSGETEDIGRACPAILHEFQPFRTESLGNLALTAGVDPQAMTQWMWASFVDGAEWVMLPNVIGMALHADGGRMATKPYASGGAYINRMSDHCSGCAYDPKKTVGDDACPLNSLYWDFLEHHRERLGGNPRMTLVLRNWERRDPETKDAILAQAGAVLERLDERGL